MSTQYIRIEQAKNYVGEPVCIKGWLYNMRSSGKIRFLELRDGSAETIQCVIVPDICDEKAVELTKTLNQESSIIVSGKLKEHHKKKGVFEIDVTNVELIHQAAPEYPISLKEHGPEHLMKYRHLWLRTPKQTAIMRVRAKIVTAIRNYFDSNGFVLMDAPMLTPNACEGLSELFETDYFDSKAFLTQSGQLYAEAGAMALGKTYTFGPTFRAEKSKTRKHLTEFWMIEPEIAFCELDDIIDLAEDFVKKVFKDVIETAGDELRILNRDLAPLEKTINTKFPRIPYGDAIELLNKNGHSLKWGADFGSPEETKLGELFDDVPVFIRGFPKEIKSFYFKLDPNDPRIALGCDLIAPDGYGEIIGGSEREADYDTLLSNMRNYGLNEDDYSWYLDLRKYGSVPHGGFGMGLERTVGWICGLDHVRETIAFPRMINYLRP